MTPTAIARIEAARAYIASLTPAQRAACLALVGATTIGRCDCAVSALLVASARKIPGTERYDGWTVTPSYTHAWKILRILTADPNAFMDFPIPRQERGLRFMESLLREAVATAA